MWVGMPKTAQANGGIKRKEERELEPAQKSGEHKIGILRFETRAYGC